jgi:hypothetical protein
MPPLIVEQPPQGAENIIAAKPPLGFAGDTDLNPPPSLHTDPETKQKPEAILQVTISPVPDVEPAASELNKFSEIELRGPEKIEENDEDKSEDLSTISDDDDDDFRRNDKDIKRLKKEITDAEKRFVRKGGIVYVSDDFWVSTLHSALNCHIFVGDSTVAIQKEMEKHPSSGDTSYQQKSRTRNQSSCLSDKVTNGVRIVNELLKEEMQQIIGVGNLNHDHVSPFRSIMPFEEQFRHLYELKEAEFSEICRKFPDHRAVKRKNEFMPTQLAYSVLNLSRPIALDSIDSARILLDGLRALVQLLDTDLRDLVATVRRLKLGRVVNNIPKLPFSHLWYLFAPGQEIVNQNPKPQVYRVLQVTGGRRSLVTRGSPKQASRRTVSDLTIDCFYIDFDGKQFGPRSFKISIRPYSDLLPVTSLPAYPLIYDEELTEAALVKRGMKFEELVKPSHRRYKGLSLKEDGQFDAFQEVGVSSRIV